MENKKGFVSMKEWGRKEYGKNAIIGLLGGYIASISGILIIEVIGDVLMLVGLILGLVWIYKTVKEKKEKRLSQAIK